MGNCLVLQDKKVIRIMRMDGKILRYQSPLKVYQALSKFPGHAIADDLPVVRYLDAKADMMAGQLYYLLPPAKPVVNSSSRAGAVQIKIVLSKQELKEILSKGGVSLDAMMSRLQKQPSTSAGDCDKHRCMVWKPALESIPEGNDPS